MPISLFPFDRGNVKNINRELSFLILVLIYCFWSIVFDFYMKLKIKYYP